MRINRILVHGFGGLQDRSWTPSPGLNIVYGENGAGKTTLLSFIKAAFYRLNAKERKAALPWSGAPAGGVLELEKGEGAYRLQVSFGATPRQDRVELLEEQTGEPVGDIDKTAIGAEFLGMNETTFEKTAFVRQGSGKISVKGEDAIAEKLSNLQQTGEDSVSYHGAKKLLEDAMRGIRLKRGRGGREAEIEDAILSLQSRVRLAQDKQKKNLQTQQELQDLSIQKGELEQQRKRAEVQRQKNRIWQLEKLEQQLNRIEEERTLPSHEEERRELQKWLEQYEEPYGEETGAYPDRDTFSRATELAGYPEKKGNPAGALLGGLLVLASVIGGLFVAPLCFLGVLVGLIIGIWFFPRASAEYGEYQDILARYGVANQQELWKVYEDGLQQTKGLERHREAERVLQQEYGTTEVSVLRERLRVWEQQEERRATASAQQPLLQKQYRDLLGEDSLEALRNRYGAGEEAREEEVSEAEWVRLCETISAKEAQLKQAFDQEQTPDELLREISQLEEEKAALTARWEALSLADRLLEQAYEELAGEFGPKLNQKAGELLRAFTNGRYDAPRINKAYEVRLSEGGELHALEQFSGGVYEQVYLAFRLAMLSLMEEQVPIFLDDPLMQYDDVRAGQTLAALEAFAREEDLQIFVCTCRSRDRELAEEFSQVGILQV